jgi:hypothetical protein
LARLEVPEYDQGMEQEHSTNAFGALGRRLVAWVVLIAVALVALKIVFGIVAGLVMAVLWSVLLVGLAVAVIWAVRRI